MKKRLFHQDHHRTLVVRIDTKKCRACWKCIEKCPEKVMGKVDILWHKHARIDQADQCKGCLKCVKVCDSGALIKIRQDKQVT